MKKMLVTAAVHRMVEKDSVANLYQVGLGSVFDRGDNEQVNTGMWRHAYSRQVRIPAAYPAYEGLMLDCGMCSNLIVRLTYCHQGKCKYGMHLTRISSPAMPYSSCGNSNINHRKQYSK